MLSSITPLGERGRQRRWGVTVIAYAVASVSSGAAVGALLGALPSPSPVTSLRVLAAACLVAALLDLRPSLLPTIHRQVNEDWLDGYRGWVCGVGYGAQLGVGVVTIVTTAAVYVTLLAAALMPSVAAGAAVGATFGFVRAAPALTLRSVSTPQRLATHARRLAALAAPARTATVVGLALLAATAAGLAAA